MPPKPPTQQMGEKHEEYLAKVNAGRKTVASGSQWTDPGDGRNAHDLPYTFAWDGKSTHGKSLTVTLDMIAKIREQALGELPQIGLRWYATEDLSSIHEDWVAVPGDDWEDILASARAWVELQTGLGDFSPDDVAALLQKVSAADDLTSTLADAHQSLLRAAKHIDEQDRELAALRQQQSAPRELAQWVPKLPWTIVHVFPKDQLGSTGDPAGTAVHYQSDGMQHADTVRSIRIQPSPVNRPHVFIDDVRLRNADVYGADGKLRARACEDDPSIEVG